FRVGHTRDNAAPMSWLRRRTVTGLSQASVTVAGYPMGTVLPPRAYRCGGFPAGCASPPAAAEGAIQGEHQHVTSLQCVRQDGLRGAGLSERGGDDQGVVRARLVPGRDENASAGGLRAAGLETDDPVLAQQRVVVADHAG